MAKKQRQYGLWDSALSPQMMAGQARLSDVQWAGDEETLVWLESRDGRGVLKVKRPGQAARAVNDRLNVRGGVGYGGGEFCVHGERIYFSADDGRIYGVTLDRGLPEPITPEWGSAASPTVSPDGQWVAYVHRHDDVDRIAVVDAAGNSWPVIAAEGADFYMQPVWHPDSDALVWVQWDHPNMPWNGTFVVSAPVVFEQGCALVGEPGIVAGDTDVACQQPMYSPDGKHLAFLSDESGWWQVNIRDVASGETRSISSPEREYATPAWVQGLRHYGWGADGKELIAISTNEGVARVDRLRVDGQAERAGIFEQYSAIGQISVSPAGNVAAIAESSAIPPRVVAATADGDEVVVRHSSSERLSAAELATVKPVSWEVDDAGAVQRVYGLYYPPTNPRFEADGKPPALVMIHGGPTSQRSARWEQRNQFFASRGWAVLDVNYRGSTGYGRQYMEALFGEWGVADVEDAVGAANFLADEGLASRDQIVIMGGSAGGYTVLQSLASRPGVFRAGVCLYGISDLFALQMGTHKFEARYNDSLIGPLPEAADRYRERSPINSADAIEDAVAIYHGAKDKVVPLDQAEVIVGSLKRRGVPHLYHVYEEEGHGWRREDTIVHFHESVLDFLTRQVIYG